MEEGKNEIMELRQMIEGCFERQNKLIARLEMELEAGPPPRGCPPGRRRRCRG